VRPTWWPVASADEPIGAAALLGPLRAARRRYARQAVLDGAAWAGLATVLVLGVLELVRYGTAGRSALPPVPGGVVAGVTLAVLAIGVAGAAVHARRSVPDLLRVARRADRHFGLDERLGTALELGYGDTGAAPRPVLSALVADAEDHAARVRPEQLVRLRVPRPAWLLALALAGVIALEQAPRAGTPVAAGHRSTAPLAALRSREEILAAATYLQQQAEERSDPGLMAAAAALRQLGDSISSGALTRDAADARLADALQRAGRALQNSAGSASPLAAGPRGGDNQGKSGGNTSENDMAPPSAEEGRAALDTLLSRLAASQPPRPQKDSGEQPGEPGLQAPGDAAPGGRPKPGSPPPGNASMQFQQLTEAELAGLHQEGDANGKAGGGAGKTSSSSTDGGAEELSPLKSSARRDLRLSLERGGAKRRATGPELPPDTKFTALPDGLPGSGAWRAGNAGALPPDHLGVSYRAVASRYFLSMTQQPGAAVEP
jgi:hypothetical protein